MSKEGDQLVRIGTVMISLGLVPTIVAYHVDRRKPQ